MTAGEARLLDAVGFAEDFGTAHERKPKDTPAAEAMDLHNNEVGRRIARQYPDAGPDELARRVEAAVRGGEMVVLDRGGQLAYSDQVGHGETAGKLDEQPDRGGREPGRPGEHYSGGYNAGGDGDNYGTTQGR
ncbi:hypothetical protein JOF53_003061 [Crossiella equi]|uniref:DUF6973 domain-containing protein n=1 Tax=Crossiella equi TaxID=130796 RepID=A0ABS5AD99_9PSEU|nr:hypothetical protein [Crossiella equi]MBP2474189.1 hypothetical protein [Crossiella equi]